MNLYNVNLVSTTSLGGECKSFAIYFNNGENTLVSDLRQGHLEKAEILNLDSNNT